MYNDRYTRRQMRRMNRGYYYRNSLSGLAGGIILIGLALAFWIGGGSFSLPVFFIALAFCILVGSISTLNPRSIYGGFYGFMWMIILALFFLTGSWIWFLVGAGLSAILGALFNPITAGMLGIGFLAASQRNQQRQYQQPYQQEQQPYQPYQQGYTPQQGTYEEGGQQHEYPPQPKQEYDQPQAQYPQEMPPQQQ